MFFTAIQSHDNSNFLDNPRHTVYFRKTILIKDENMLYEYLQITTNYWVLSSEITSHNLQCNNNVSGKIIFYQFFQLETNSSPNFYFGLALTVYKIKKKF